MPVGDTDLDGEIDRVHPQLGEVQVVDALLGLPKVPCCVGEVWTQTMVSGSPSSGSLAVMESVTT